MYQLSIYRYFKVSSIIPYHHHHQT
jgi:hypothetical protein